jgi:2-dehydro-3-deoxyphosphogluconate aldolase/(4S)-4-hydroxy-2-oxoglutarate aldolase
MLNTVDCSLREIVVAQTKATGILPCIKLPTRGDFLAYAQAMYDGGARVIEITMTTPGALEGIEAISSEFSGRLWVAAGTVLDAATAREVILHGGSVLVNPAVIPEVIQLGNRYGVPVYSGAFSATECFTAMELGAAMVKIFPAALGGPAYMTNLRMVFPQINLIPSGGVTLDNAADFIVRGACAVSGARIFMDFERIAQEGLHCVTERVADFIELVRQAKTKQQPIP